MNKNIIVVGAMAAGLYLLAQANKTKRVIAKKKAPQRPKRKYPKPHYYRKPKIKKLIARKKAVYNKPKRVIAKKKAVYNKPKIKKAVAKKKIAIQSTKPQKKKSKIKYHIAV